MKKLSLLFICQMTFMSFQALATYIKIERDAQNINLSYDGASLNHQIINGRIDNTIIEPLSPVLGTDIVLGIRRSNKTPSEILKILKNRYQANPKEIQQNLLSYVRSLKQGLVDYCKNAPQTLGPWEVVDNEHASIPINVLNQYHEQYIKAHIEIAEIENLKELKELALKESLEYQNLKYDCHSVNKLTRLENKAKKLMFKHWDNLVDLNHEISSPEAAFPRQQFSINGLTQYVFAELMKIEQIQLEELLEEVYQAQNEWKDSFIANEGTSLIDFVINKVSKNHDRRLVILALSYSTRNMPSLDTQYAIDASKALALEVYFWKLRTLRDEFMSEIYKLDIYPRHDFERNPGMYHYMTATLLAYEVKCHKYSGLMAKNMSILSKVGYKLDKLFAYNKDSAKGKDRIKSLIATAKEQGLKYGIEAGLHGGRYGVKQCRLDKKSMKKKNKSQRSE